MQVTHNNHFVSQSYLKRWSEDGHRIWCYAVLASHEKVPVWVLQSIRAIAYKRDLYTTLASGQEVDDFEQWLAEEIEDPAQVAIERAIHGDILSSSDWERLIRYMAAQDLRTPQYYIESVLRWNERLPQILQQTLTRAVHEIEEAKRTGREFEVGSASNQQPFADSFRVSVGPRARTGTNQGEIKVEVTVSGRRLWLETQRHILNDTIKVAFSHSWSIAEAVDGMEWFTSDHPVACVNYYGKGNYDLRGGWGNRGGNLLMPLSPRHLLFTQIGADLPRRFTLSQRQTSEIQRFIAERAHRTIFARRRMSRVKRLRPRHVDGKIYQEEQEAWRNWHNNQSRAEQDLEQGE